MTNFVSIVIRTYNEEKHIGKLLEVLKKQNFNRENFEIIIVDSGSNDRTIEIAKKFADSIVFIKKNKFTFGYSLNKGIENSNGNLLIFISAHCYPADNNWINNLINPFKDKNIAAVYGKQRGGKHNAFSEKEIYYSWYPTKTIANQKHPFCNNANIAIRKELWQKYKYNEKLTGLEDLDWANRVLSNESLYLYYSAEAKIIHHHNESYKKIFNRYKREGIAYSNVFPLEKFTFLNFVNLFVRNTISDYKYARNNKVLLKNIYYIPLYRFLQLYGTYNGRNYKKEVNYELAYRFYYPRK